MCRTSVYSFNKIKCVNLYSCRAFIWQDDKSNARDSEYRTSGSSSTSDLSSRRFNWRKRGYILCSLYRLKYIYIKSCSYGADMPWILEWMICELQVCSNMSWSWPMSSSSTNLFSANLMRRVRWYSFAQMYLKLHSYVAGIIHGIRESPHAQRSASLSLRLNNLSGDREEHKSSDFMNPFSTQRNNPPAMYCVKE